MMQIIINFFENLSAKQYYLAVIIIVFSLLCLIRFLTFKSKTERGLNFFGYQIIGENHHNKQQLEQNIYSHICSNDLSKRQVVANELPLLGKVFGRYRNYLLAMLAFFDKYWGKPENNGASIWDYFTIKSLDKSLLLAVIYPTIIALIIWCFANKPLIIAGIKFADAVELWQGLIVFVGIIALILHGVILSKSEYINHKHKFFSISILCIFGIFGIEIFEDTYRSITYTIILFLTLLSFFKKSYGISVAIVSFNIILIEFGNYLPSYDIFKIVIVCILALLYIAAISKLFDNIWLSICLMLALVALIFSTKERTLPLLVMTAILPIINAIFDWISLSASRYFLNKNLTQNVMWDNVFFDALVALFCIIGVAATSVFVIYLINQIAGENILDISGHIIALTQINSDKFFNVIAEHGWILIAFYSTFLPTVIHLGFMIISALCPTKINIDFSETAKNIENGNFCNGNNKSEAIEIAKKIAPYFILFKSEFDSELHVPEKIKQGDLKIIDTLIILTVIILVFYLIFAYAALGLWQLFN